MTTGVINIINKINAYATLLNIGVKNANPIAIIEAMGIAKFLYVIIEIVLDVISFLRRYLWFFAYAQIK